MKTPIVLQNENVDVENDKKFNQGDIDKLEDDQSNVLFADWHHSR